MAARTNAQNLPVRGSLRWTEMEASEAEQKATTKIATEARRVGSVLISKTNFMTERRRVTRCGRSLEQKGMKGTVADGRECRNNRS